jgi:hypothetical protein
LLRYGKGWFNCHSYIKKMTREQILRYAARVLLQQKYKYYNNFH